MYAVLFSSKSEKTLTMCGCWNWASLWPSARNLFFSSRYSAWVIIPPGWTVVPFLEQP